VTLKFQNKSINETRKFIMQKAHEIIFAGFGGQGVLSMGQIIAYASMIENKEVSWMPSYGPEMRGGTANCTVIVSDTKISSPMVARFDSAIVLNQPSLDKFEKSIKPGGLLMYETSSILNPPTRDDIEIYSIPASEEALKMNKKQVANMIMVGAFLQIRPILKIENILKALKKVLPERHHHTIPLNEKALLLGQQLAKELEHLVVQ
jgi:2-oxoglutarate ferredoxin oxidoreductase subunit gamma